MGRAAVNPFLDAAGNASCVSRHNPEVVVRVQREPVGAIEAGCERHTGTGAAIRFHGNLYDVTRSDAGSTRRRGS